MRLTAPKTWSQHQLAVKLGMEPAGKPRWLSREHRRLLIHATKTALAAGFCWWLALRFGLHDGYWGAISAIIVLQSNVGATITASRDRLLGTLIGAVLGFGFSFVGTLPWNYLAAVILAITICGLLGFKSSSRLAGVTITILMLVQHGGSHWTIALDRVGQVALGIVVALGVSTFIFPDRARLRLRDGLAQELLLLGAYFEGILRGFRGKTPEQLSTMREDALAILDGNDDLLEAARSEPSGGPGWREGLNMLAQFGRSLMDALTALELAVKDSREDGYALHLEPELGKLVVDIRTGFHYVANCVHRWVFHVAPKEIDLEADITALEARMAEVRLHGLNFSQAEILRAYAVLLHLKQIARLLRAARVETSRAIGEARRRDVV
ncbi:MAG: FUSC family protein [Terracidiphilus sp.]